jgi:dipeptidyl aminopeptidase/acylaminoacyl peptidase
VRALRLPALLLSLSAALACAAPAWAATDGPRIALVEWRAEPPMTRLVTVAPDGSGRRTLPLAGVQPVPFAGPAWSPDGTSLVFAGYRVDAGGDSSESGRPWLFIVGAEGGVPQPLPGTAGGSHPVLSPDGATVAFRRGKLVQRYDPDHPLRFGFYFSVTAWVVSLDGGPPRRLTPWRNGLVNEPAAFSPDGSVLLIERDRGPAAEAEIVARPLAGGPLRVIARRAVEPAFSPDGTRIAMVSFRDRLSFETGDGPVSMGELYVTRADGSEPHRLTRSPRAQESQPSWDPSGSRISFLRVPGPGGLGFGSVLFQTDPDGACLRRVTGGSGRSAPALYGPAWQPGLGREAGPISC